MSSPFPGMNPYLEQPDAWHDFHNAFCLAIREAIVPQVRPRYVAKLDEHVFIHELSAEERRFVGRGDVTIAHEPNRPTPPLAGNRTTTPASAIGLVEHAIDEERLSFIEIRDRSIRKLITVIELLSPSNNNNEADRGQDLGKRRSVFARWAAKLLAAIDRTASPAPSPDRHPA